MKTKFKPFSLHELDKEIAALKRAKAGKGSPKDRWAAEQFVKFFPEAKQAFPHLREK